MARSILVLALALVAPLVSAYSFTGSGRASLRVAPRRAAAAAGAGGLRMESFGLPFAENPNENSDVRILGEAKYKTQFIKSYKPKSLLLTGDLYPVFKTVQKKKLLSTTADVGLLSQLTELGFGLSDIEKILPVLEQSGALSLASKNLPFLLNVIGYLVIEPGEIAIPTIAAALKTPPIVFQAAGAGIIGWDAYSWVAGLEPALIGVPLKLPLTLLTLPLAALLIVAGGVLQKGGFDDE